MIIRCVLIGLSVGMAACETVPATLDPALFASQIAQVAEAPNPAAADAELSALLDQTDLTLEQRADALHLRSERRLEARFDLPGALADYDAFAALAPEDPRVASIERRKVFAASEIDSAQRRLAQLQNLSDWFDDKVLMGDMDAAAARYRSAGLTPKAEQFELLQTRGYFCAVGTEAVHRFGDRPDYVADAFWCADEEPNQTADLNTDPSDS